MLVDHVTKMVDVHKRMVASHASNVIVVKLLEIFTIIFFCLWGEEDDRVWKAKRLLVSLCHNCGKQALHNHHCPCKLAYYCCQECKFDHAE